MTRSTHAAIEDFLKEIKSFPGGKAELAKLRTSNWQHFRGDTLIKFYDDLSMIHKTLRPRPIEGGTTG